VGEITQNVERFQGICNDKLSQKHRQKPALKLKISSYASQKKEKSKQVDLMNWLSQKKYEFT